MNRFTSQSITRVTMQAGAERYEAPTLRQNFYVVVSSAVAEFDAGLGVVDAREALLTLSVTGDRYRILKAGPKHVGAGGMEYSGARLPNELVWLVYQMYDAALFSDAEVAQRHAERLAYNQSKAEQGS